MINREIKFEIKLKAKESVNGYTTYETVIIVNDIFNRQNGIAFWSIDKKFEIVYKRQFTGLTDKNGRDIYEGDIVELFGWGSQIKSDGNASIIWDDDENGWNFSRVNYAEDRYDFRKAINNCIVIGNIYENPELINSNQKS